MIKQHTPLRRLVFRNTRPLLREYVRQGLLNDNVPTRDPHLVWIPMRDEERGLYERIEEYITHFYQKYENERKGLGFVMTVYRRRLTSSFYAVQRSLERRLAFLRGQAGLSGLRRRRPGAGRAEPRRRRAGPGRAKPATGTRSTTSKTSSTTSAA